jgi:hypothetical protein
MFTSCEKRSEELKYHTAGNLLMSKKIKYDKFACYFYILVQLHVLNAWTFACSRPSGGYRAATAAAATADTGHVPTGAVIIGKPCLFISG